MKKTIGGITMLVGLVAKPTWSPTPGGALADIARFTA